MTDGTTERSCPDGIALLAQARAAWSGGRIAEAVRNWRRAATALPDTAAPYVNLAGSGDRSAWVEDAAMSIAPGDSVIARNFGVLAHGRGTVDRAAVYIKRSLVLDPSHAGSVLSLARLAADVDRLPGLDWAERATVADPTGQAGWLMLLRGLLNADRIQDAVARAANVTLPVGRWSDDLLDLVMRVYVVANRYDDAFSVVAELVRRNPLDANVRTVWAMLHRRRGDRARGTREACRSAILEPGSFSAARSAATELCHIEAYEAAEKIYRRCLWIGAGRRFEILENYAVSLHQLGRKAEGDGLLREYLIQAPNHSKSYMNMSAAAIRSDSLPWAERLAKRAVICDDDSAESHYNLAAIRRHMGQAAASRASLDRAMGIDPVKPDYHFSRALLELGDGDPVDGVKRYESRWNVPHFASWRRLSANPSLALPVWSGQRLPEATLAVWGEQGVGDELWFSSYLGWALERVGRAVLEVTPNLVGLMRRTFPEVDVRPRAKPETDAALAAADLQVPIGGIMLPYGAGAKPVPTGYIATDPARVARMRDRYTGGRNGVRVIGLSWRSVKVKKNASFEAPLDRWRPVFEAGDAIFVSLQYGDVRDDVEQVRQQFGVDLIVDPEVDAYQDVDALAAQLAATDEVVSIANSTVALAHGLAKPVHVILRTIQEDWRYARRRETTRWLPTARCYWQTESGDWSAPMAAVAAQLRG